MIELACPESCHYLRSAREQAGPREVALRAREMQAEGRSISDINERILAITFTIEKATIESQRATEGLSLQDLDDSEALAAVENTIKNLETEESGLIYEHRAQSPRVQQVSQRIREGLIFIPDLEPVLDLHHVIFGQADYVERLPVVVDLHAIRGRLVHRR